MKRRTFLRSSAYVASPLPAFAALSSCSGGGDGASDPKCQASSFALGLTPATAEILAVIETPSALAFTSAATTPSVGTAPTAPAYFNLTDAQNLAQYGFPNTMLPAPSSQGAQGSCVAWGVGYAMGSFANALSLSSEAQTPGNQVSPSDLYAKILRREAGNPCGNGTLVKDAMDVFVDEGVATLSAAPYTDSFCRAPVAGTIFIDGYNSINVSDRAAIKFALSNFLVLPFGMQVYPDFQRLGSSVYVHPANDNTCSLGGHCMALVGYDDQRAAYRLINSWGASWGDGGHGWISYDTFERIASEIYAPYKRSSRAPNSLVPSQASTSGAITAQSAFSRVWLNESTGKFDRVFFDFRLNDAIGMRSCTLWFYPQGATTPVTLGTKRNLQILRGGRFEFSTTDDAYLRSSSSGLFALNLVGVSRFNESIDLTVFTSYPPPGSR